MAYSIPDPPPPYKFPWGEFEHLLTPLLKLQDMPPEARAIEQFRRLYKDDREAQWKFERVWAARKWLLLYEEEIWKTEFCEQTRPGSHGLHGDFLWGLHQWLARSPIVGAVPLPTVAEVVAIAKTASDVRKKQNVD